MKNVSRIHTFFGLDNIFFFWGIGLDNVVREDFIFFLHYNCGCTL